jgi:hypothetical protein
LVFAGSCCFLAITTNDPMAWIFVSFFSIIAALLPGLTWERFVKVDCWEYHSVFWLFGRQVRRRSIPLSLDHDAGCPIIRDNQSKIAKGRRLGLRSEMGDVLWIDFAQHQRQFVRAYRSLKAAWRSLHGL